MEFKDPEEEEQVILSVLEVEVEFKEEEEEEQMIWRVLEVEVEFKEKDEEENRSFRVCWRSRWSSRRKIRRKR